MAAGLDRAAFVLDYGVDESPCDPSTLAVDESGMRFESPWKFAVGSCLSVTIPGEMKCDGVVVECQPGRNGFYETQLLFVETLCRCNDQVFTVSR
jgi:hypothetical protein